MVVCRNKGYIPGWKNLPLRFCKRPRPIIAFFATMLTVPPPCIYIHSYTSRRMQVVLSRSLVVQCYKQLYYNKKLYYIITFYNCIYCIYTIYTVYNAKQNRRFLCRRFCYIIISLVSLGALPCCAALAGLFIMFKNQRGRLTCAPCTVAKAPQNLRKVANHTRALFCLLAIHIVR